MIWPTLSVDNFFNDPIKVKKFALSLNYNSDKEGRWPGQRTISTEFIDKEFYLMVIKKIFAILYPMNTTGFRWSASQYFQKISNSFTEKGWVHQDLEYEFTAIIYLSEHENCGTSIYMPKKFDNTIINLDKKFEAYTDINNIKNKNKYLEENNQRFEKSITVNSKFNRLMIFDGSHYHAAEKFIENNIIEDRLTLITFFNDISCDNIKYPIPQMRRI